jgi:hypothetical protein
VGERAFTIRTLCMCVTSPTFCWLITGQRRVLRFGRDTVLAIRADEATHREVNHTFASIKEDDYNPFYLRSGGAYPETLVICVLGHRGWARESYCRSYEENACKHDDTVRYTR